MNRLIVPLLTLATFTAGTAEYVLTGQLDLISTSLGVSEAAVGQLVTVFSVSYGLFTPLVLALTARFDRRMLMMIALAIFAATNLASWALPAWSALAVLRIPMAVATGVVVVTALGLVVRLVPEDRRARGLAVVLMGFTASLVLGVPAGRALAEAAGWTTVFPVIAIIAAAVLVAVRTVLPPSPPASVLPLRAQLRVLRSRATIIGLTITFLWLAGYSIVYTYLTPLLLEPIGLPAHWVGLVLLLFGIASLVGTHLGGIHADRSGFVRALVSSKAMHILTFAALPFLFGAPVAAVVVVLLWSLVAWASAPGQQMRVAGLDPEASEVLLGFNQSVMQLAIAAGAAGGGAVVASFGVGALPIVGAIVVLGSLLLLLAFQHDRSRVAMAGS